MSDLGKHGPKRPAQQAFDEYAQAVGYLLREWNWLHEELRACFGVALRPTPEAMANTVWHAIPNDRWQRAALRAAARQLLDPTNAVEANILGEIEWLATTSDGLGNRRDDAAHAPVTLMVGDPIPEVIAFCLGGHPRALSFRDSRMLEVLTAIRHRAEALRKYAAEVRVRFTDYRSGRTLAPFPDRPSLPDISQKKTSGEGRRRKEKAKAPKPPPRSSPE